MIDLWPKLLACRQIDAVDSQLAEALKLDPVKHKSIGLVTCDQDDSLYVALDHCTKFANVEVLFGQSFYAGSKVASGPFSGEVMGIVAGVDPDEVAEALWALRNCLREEVRFQTFEGENPPAFLAHVIAETGTYLSPQAGVKAGDAMAYLIAPPLEATEGIDAALKEAPVKLAKWIPPPSETNFAGAFLIGALADLNAARDAFIEKVEAVAKAPLQASRRPDRLRR